MRTRLAESVLALALVAVLGWPLVATVVAAVAQNQFPTAHGGGLMAPAPADVSTGGVRRPLGLAVETTRLVLATEALSLPIGLPLAFLLFRTDAWGRRGLIALLAVAAFVPLPLHATAWLGALGNAGRAQAIGAGPVLVGWTGAAFVHAMAALPWIVLLAGVGLRTVEPELEEAALLDLPGWRVALGVTFRRGLGAVAAASLAVAVLTAGDMTVTDLLQVRTYAEESYLQYNLGNGAGASAVALPPLVVLGGLIVLGARALLDADPARLPTATARPRVWRLGSWRVPLGAAAVALVGNLIALPLYSLVWRAGRVGGIAAAGRAPRWSVPGLLGTLRFAWDEAWEPLVTSVTHAAAGASVAVVLAWGLAWASRRPGPWRWVTLLSAALALATPGPVAGMALVNAYVDFPSPTAGVVAALGLTAGFGLRPGPGRRLAALMVAVATVAAVAAPDWLVGSAVAGLGRATPDLYSSSFMLVVVAALRTFPYSLLVLWPAVRTIPPEFLDAAAVDGLGPWGQAWRVALPLTRPAVVAAWGVAFVLAFGELPATNLVTPPGVAPLSYVVWSLLHTGVESHLAGVVLVMLAVVAAAGLVVAAALGRAFRGDRPS